MSRLLIAAGILLIVVGLLVRAGLPICDQTGGVEPRRPRFATHYALDSGLQVRQGACARGANKRRFRPVGIR